MSIRLSPNFSFFNISSLLSTLLLKQLLIYQVKISGINLFLGKKLDAGIEVMGEKDNTTIIN